MLEASSAIPRVSVNMITYNHEPFIAQAIEGVLMQETDFPIELLIHDDASTDRTAEIVREYEKKHPDIIKPIYQTENQYSQGKKPGLANRLRAKGEFLASCEGDDYWTDPKKLQKQVNLLDARPDCAMCFTSCVVVDEEGVIIGDDKVPESCRRDLSSRDIITHATPPILTVMIRISALPTEMPPEYFRVLNGDTFFCAIAALSGGAAYISECTAAYRKHGGGIWAYRPDYLKHRARATTFTMMSLVFPEEYRADLLRQAHIELGQFRRMAWKEKKYRDYLSAVAEVIWLDLRLGSFGFLRLGKKKRQPMSA